MHYIISLHSLISQFALLMLILRDSWISWLDPCGSGKSYCRKSTQNQKLAAEGLQVRSWEFSALWLITPVRKAPWLTKPLCVSHTPGAKSNPQRAESRSQDTPLIMKQGQVSIFLSSVLRASLCPCNTTDPFLFAKSLCNPSCQCKLALLL
jgi:hypothetical protein